MKTIEAVELFGVLKDVKLSGIDTADRMAVIRNLRSLREVADRYNADLELAKERLKPDGYDDLVMRMLESNEEVANGGKRTVSDAEIATFNRMNEEYNRNMKVFRIGCFDPDKQSLEGGIDNEPADIHIETIQGTAFETMVEANKELNALQLAVLYDWMVVLNG